MIVGVLVLEIFFPYAQSLKDKRRILHGFKERLKGRHNVAVAELDHQDKWQRSSLGIVTLNSRAASSTRRSRLFCNAKISSMIDPSTLI